MEDKRRELISFLINPSSTSSSSSSSSSYEEFYNQEDTGANKGNSLTQYERKLYLDIINKRKFELKPLERTSARRILNKLDTRQKKTKFKKAVFYVEDLMKKYKSLQIINEKIKNLNQEKRWLKLALETEYEDIRKRLRSIKTGSNIGLDYMIYKIKDDTSDEEEYNYYKKNLGKKKIKKYYIDREPDLLYKY